LRVHRGVFTFERARKEARRRSWMAEEKRKEEAKGAEEERSPEELLEHLEKELEEARKEAQEHYDKFLRLYAEFENYKKRVAREKADLVKYGNEELLRELLPVVDNLERALEHAKKKGDPEAIIEGVELVLEQFLQVLRRFGVEPIAAVGEQFDPERHEAVAEEATDEAAPGEVIAEVQKGYMLNDRLLRPAKVVVAKEKGEVATSD